MGMAAGTIHIMTILFEIPSDVNMLFMSAIIKDPLPDMVVTNMDFVVYTTTVVYVVRNPLQTQTIYTKGRLQNEVQQLSFAVKQKRYI